MSPAKPRLRVVVDGSNVATEGRVLPSLAQLNEAVAAFAEEYPGAEVIVVADATFEHRVASSERARFNDAVLAGDIVTPPAGALGRGDAFILKIADRISGVVLSNDSFQEFHDEYPWLFEVGRLIGGKPVRGVGWVFTARIPVRNVKTTRATKKLALTLPGGATPAIGTTLTPVKAAKKVVKKAVAKGRKSAEKVVERAGSKAADKVIDKGADKAGDKAAPSSARGTAKATKRTTKSNDATKKTVKKAVKAVKAKKPAIAPVVALRRDREPVNPEGDFAAFRTAYRVGAKVPGEVMAFTSHGAIIKVALKSAQHVECYAPTTSLGTPAPARARDVLKRGDQRTFRLITVDSERRIAELALA